MQFSKILPMIGLYGILATSFCADTKVEFSPQKSIAKANFARKAPVIDGKISKNEYTGSFENFGLLKHNNNFLASRQGRVFTALDSKYLYFAMQTEMPDADSNVKLKARYKRRDSKIFVDDSVEFLFVSPVGDAVYHLIANSADRTYDFKYPIINGGVTTSKLKNWTPDLKIKSGFDKKYWTIEVAIPLKDINIKSLQPISKWKMQFARTWRNPSLQTALNRTMIFVNPNEMNDVVFVKNTPSVRFRTLGDNYLKGENNIKFTVDNPTSTTQKVKYSISVVSEAAPRGKDGVITLAPGKSQDIEIKFTEKSRVNFDLKAIFYNSKNEIIYQRNFFWQNPPEKRWIAPDAKNSSSLEFGVYPYLTKVRVRLGNSGVPYDMRKVASATAFITDAKGKAMGGKLKMNSIPNIGFDCELPLDLSKKGNYFVVVEVKNNDGKVNTYKEKFEFEKFAWEHNKLGKDRVVLPPYKPLIYNNSKVKTLLAEYTLNNGFLSAIKVGKAEKLLASPITLTVNGKKPVQKNFKWLEKSDDLGISISNLTLANVNFKVKNEFEFDNFIKTTLTVEPENSFDFKSMTLDIPLNGKFASQIHSTCNAMKYNFANTLPTKDGEIWNSAMGKLHASVSNNFRPYIWLGTLGEGLAFFAESDKNWSRNDKKPMAQIFRKNGVVTLRINFIDKPVVRKKPFEIVFGFQSTPTRLLPNEARQYSGRIRMPNTVVTSTLAGGMCWASYGYDFFPINHDYSFINALKKEKNKKGDNEWQKKFVKDYMAKNCKSVANDHLATFERHLLRGLNYANNSNFLVPYMNSRATMLRWPEYRVFMDEWFCSEFRANNEDDYNNSPVESYQDYLLDCIKKLLDAGLDGVYYDNIRDWTTPNVMMGPAYQLPSGKVQPYFDIFDMRNLIKRTATLLYKEGKTFFDGRPIFVLHMTNTNLIPFTSLGGVTLDCEANYGSTDFQERFTEDWLKISAIGIQSGSIPEVLIQITGNNISWTSRTFLATVLAYDINSVMNAGGLANVYFVTQRKLKNYGYGTDKVKVYPCYAPSGAVKTSADVRISEYHNVDGSKVFCVSSFGYAGDVKLEFADKFSRIEDFENGKAMSSTDGKSVSFKLKKHDFRLIKVNK
ncbi:MAG: hypothetical protein IKA22_10800 [Lentisphaeria bacterium]|nr:hypothetical protein [Lentisphaeria bacterium]